VIRVAFPARLLRKTAVVASLRGDVLRRVFVAFQAQGVLSFLPERLMTLAALSFYVRMSLYHLSRHDQLFHGIRKSRFAPQPYCDQ